MLDLKDIALKFRALRKQHGLTQGQFAEKIGISRSLLSQIEIARSTPTLEIIANVTRIFNVSADDFLISGKKEMSPLQKGSEIGEPGKKESLYTGDKIRPVVATVAPSGEENIVLVEQKAAAGYLVGYQDQEYIEKLPAFNLPGYQGRTYRAFEVQGDSMWPALHAGDYVVCEYVENWLHVRDGYCYVVVAEEGVLVKRVLNRLDKKNHLILKSDNHSYPNIKLSGNDLREIWMCKIRMTPQLGSPYMDLYRRMDDLEAIVHEIIENHKKTEK